MFVITNHKTGDYVLVGPSEWRPRFFSNIISEEVESTVIITSEDEKRVPYSPYEDIVIRRCKTIYEDVNESTQYHEGPFWEYIKEDEGDLGYAIATFTAKDKHKDLIINSIRKHAAKKRWEKENIYIDVNLGNYVLSVNTSRQNREALLRKYIIMDDHTNIKWKLKEDEWCVLSKNDVKNIITKTEDYIQNIFDEENLIVEEAKNCSSVEELKQIFTKYSIDYNPSLGRNR
jgi:hypothetical protein